MWTLELEAMHAIGAAFVLTCHPFLSGRPARARALELLIDRMAALPGLWITTVGEVAQHVSGLGLNPAAMSAAGLARRGLLGRAPVT